MRQNIYEMYVANGNRAGFWVERNSLGNTVALVKAVACSVEGPLSGKPRYFGNPPVHGDVFNATTGELLEADAELSCPGNYSYVRVEPPQW